MSDLLAISLARFAAEKVLARDVFLQMPKNGKNIRIASTGDEIRPELLQRLHDRGVTQLLVSRLSPNDDPDTCRIYEVPPSSALESSTTLIQENVQASGFPQFDDGQIISAARDSDFGHPEPLREHDAVASAQGAASVLPPESTEQQLSRVSPTSESEDSGSILSKPPRLSSDESALAEHGQIDAAERFDGPMKPEDPEQRFSPSEIEPEPAHNVSGGQSPESLSRIAGKKQNPTEGEEKKRISGALDVGESTNSIPKNEQPAREKGLTGGNIMESLSRIAGRKPVMAAEKSAGADVSMSVEEVIVSGLRNTLEEIVQVVSGEADMRAGEPVQALKAELEQCLNALAPSRDQPMERLIIAAGASLAQAVKAFNESSELATEGNRLAADISDAVENAKRQFTDAAAKLAKAQSFTGNSEEKFEKRFEAEKITSPENEELYRDRPGLSAGDQPESWRDRPENSPTDATETFRGAADHSMPLPEISIARDEDPTGLEARIHDSNSKTVDLHYSESSRAAIYKELPATAGRMATLLAHSIGYANPAYLSDLAVATMAYFFRKEGKSIAGTSLPSLAHAVLEARNSDFDSSVSDSMEIIQLLETYFDNPECDRSSKEFSRRIFRESLEGFRVRSNGLNRWNEARWSQFVEKGPSIDAQSVCGRASARAVKLARQLAS